MAPIRTVVYPLLNDTKDYNTLTHELGAVMSVHGAVMVIAAFGFGYTSRRARFLPPWTAIALMAGVTFVALAQSVPEGAQLVAAGIRELGFAGMGDALVRKAHHARNSIPTAGVPTVPTLRRD